MKIDDSHDSSYSQDPLKFRQRVRITFGALKCQGTDVQLDNHFRLE